MHLIIDYPWYFYLFVLLLGMAYAGLLYYLPLRRRRGEDDSVPTGRLRLVLAVVRTLAVALIAFLLLSPLVKRATSRHEKPIVLVAEDNSRSLNLCRDSAYYHGDFQQAMERMVKELEQDFEVHRFRYGAQLRQHSAEGDALFEDNATDMAAAIEGLMEQYYHRNVGALIVTGDGIYNSGQHPGTAAAQLTVPLYTVAMGDTTVRRDAAVANVRFNRIAYLGNEFPMEVTLRANRMAGERARLSVSLDGKQLFSKEITYDDDHFTAVETVTLEAKAAGMHHYVVELSPLADEQSVRNNRRMVAIEVIDGHQKVAIVAAVPHPDVAALRRAIEGNRNYEVETFLARELQQRQRTLRPDDYNLIILHQLPGKAATGGLDVEGWARSATPMLFVLGSQSDLSRLNTLHAGLEVFARINRQNEATAIGNKSFTFFTLDEETLRCIEHFPPLVMPFGEYRVAASAQSLFGARIGNVNSGQPLVVASAQGRQRYSFICGEGLWRWRLADYQANSSHAHFDELISKLVTFTALRLNKEQFHVEMEGIFGELEDVVAEAQLYDDNYEPVNSADVEFELEGRRYAFNRTGSGYSLNLGTLPPGSYRWTARTLFNGKQHQASGSFMVEDLQLETLDLTADHSLLSTLAAQSGGAMVEAHDVEQLPKMLRERDDLHTVIFSETRYSDMLNMPLIFILIVLLLGLEWVVRKYEGSL